MEDRRCLKRYISREVYTLLRNQSSQGNCLELTLFKQIKLGNYLIGLVLLGASNEQASKQPVLMVQH